MTFCGWEEWLTRHTPSVRARIERLNPNRVPGTKIRGYHPSQHAGGFSTSAYGMPFQMVVKHYGREAWDNMPVCQFMRSGKRFTIRIEALQDHLWRLPADHPERSARMHKNGMWEIPTT